MVWPCPSSETRFLDGEMVFNSRAFLSSFCLFFTYLRPYERKACEAVSQLSLLWSLGRDGLVSG